MNMEERCQQIELILSDVDGVLTEGHVVLDNQGVETKFFHIHDGMGIKLWQKAGYRFGMLTHRSSQALKVRSAELGVEIVRQSTNDKLTTARQILEEHALGFEQFCYVGDDLPDLPVLRAAGLAVAVANATPEVAEAAHYRTTLPGGSGAVRETIEMILKAQRRWDDMIQQYMRY